MSTAEIIDLLAKALKAQEIMNDLRAENAKMREAGNALHTYLTAKVGPIEDIPDEIFKPFVESLKHH